MKRMIVLALSAIMLNTVSSFAFDAEGFHRDVVNETASKHVGVTSRGKTYTKVPGQARLVSISAPAPGLPMAVVHSPGASPATPLKAPSLVAASLVTPTIHPIPSSTIRIAATGAVGNVLTNKGGVGTTVATQVAPDKTTIIAQQQVVLQQRKIITTTQAQLTDPTLTDAQKKAALATLTAAQQAEKDAKNKANVASTDLKKLVQTVGKTVPKPAPAKH